MPAYFRRPGCDASQWDFCAIREARPGDFPSYKRHRALIFIQRKSNGGLSAQYADARARGIFGGHKKGQCNCRRSLRLGRRALSVNCGNLRLGDACAGRCRRIFGAIHAGRPPTLESASRRISLVHQRGMSAEARDLRALFPDDYRGRARSGCVRWCDGAAAHSHARRRSFAA
jgi:hypothetical protein